MGLSRQTFKSKIMMAWWVRCSVHMEPPTKGCTKRWKARMPECRDTKNQNAWKMNKLQISKRLWIIFFNLAKNPDFAVKINFSCLCCGNSQLTVIIILIINNRPKSHTILYFHYFILRNKSQLTQANLTENYCTIAGLPLQKDWHSDKDIGDSKHCSL